MAKIKCGARPKHFARTIIITMPEGGKGTVEMSYIYRTRSEFGKFVDELLDGAGVKSKGSTDEDVKFSLREVLEKTRDQNADYILKIADGWNLEEEFTRDNIAQLCDELPAAAIEIIEGYRAAVTEGKLGN